MANHNNKILIFALVLVFGAIGKQAWGVEPPVHETNVLLGNAKEITFTQDSQKITSRLELEKPAGVLYPKASAAFETTTLLKNDTGVSNIPTCGNGTCNEAETCDSCPEDCICQCGDIEFNCDGQCGQCPGCSPCCGDGTCNGTENNVSCNADCPAACGDKTCNGSETCSSCPGDCGACPAICGDKTCNGSETCSSCPGDCGACGPKI